MNIENYLSEQKLRIDQALSKYLKANSDCPPGLYKAMQYSLEAGGKRIRPILALAAAQAVGGSLEPVLPVACALEMIHTFSLIHDDLPSMDNDDLRRGVPTNHKVFGEAMAVLAGDGLLSEAFHLLCHADVSRQIPPATLIDVIRDIAFATGPGGMVGGQALDLEAEGKNLNAKDLETVHRYKTGRLITISVTSGAKIAGASSSQQELLKVYGEKIGLAFQIADDILNVEGTKEAMGKSVGSDQTNQKSTYPKVLGMEASKKMAKELIDQATLLLKDFGAPADPLCEIAQYIVLRKN
ncbi:MAG: polyprenyl synthetase family protein [Deltaproteobacteria bacterium]|nr:polyprenyl synthetase family protein [Deltaproteobacteria bacterium]